MILPNPPAWVFPSASLDFDFAHQRYFQIGKPNDIPELVTCTRATTGYIQYEDFSFGLVSVNVPRISNLGLLVEPASTNSIRNNSMQGAVVSGAAPNNWTFGAAGGITPTVAALGTESGMDYIDILFSGTPSSGGTISVFFDVGITGSAAQVWAGSVFLKLQAGSLTNITTPVLINQDFGTGGTSSSTSFSTITGNALGSQRFTSIHTNGGSAGFSQRLVLNLTVNTGNAINLTLRVGWPQLELNGSVSSPIRTINTAVTRNSDIVTAPNIVWGTALSVYAEGSSSLPISASSQTIAAPYATVGGDRFSLDRTVTTGNARTLYIVGGTIVSNVNTGVSWAQNTNGKIAVAGQSGDQAISFNGNAVATGTGGGVPNNLDSFGIGQNSGSIGWQGYIRRVALWPTTRLPNATLGALTT